MSKNLTQAQSLWTLLGDIPIDDNDCIEEPFQDFPIGTFKEEIWLWFEETFNVSVYDDLMFTNQNKNK